MTLSIDLTVPLGQFDLQAKATLTERVTGVFGPSGAGKTTLLEVVAGVRRARGRLTFQGESWLDGSRSWTPEARGVGWVPQDGLLFQRHSVRANLISGSARAGREASRLLDEVIATLRLGPLLGRDVATLSGGERQRVALGRALCSAPRILLLDEPFGALDLPLRRSLLPFLHRLTRRFDLPTLLVSHDPVEVQLLCDEVLVLEAGGVTAQGSPQEILADSAVWQLGSQEGYNNVLPCVVLQTSQNDCRVRVGECELATVAPSGKLQAADESLLEVAARDVIVALERPQGISARNILPARVARVRPFAGGQLAEVEVSSAQSSRSS